MEALAYALPAGQAMLQMALFCLVGIVFGIYPRPNGLLSPDTLKSLSGQIFWLYTPALMLATFGSKLSWEMLLDTMGIMIWSVIHAAVNLLLSLLITRVVPIEPHFKASFRLASTFNNSASVPLLLLSGLCKSAELISDVEAYSRAVAYVFMYSLLWNFAFWSGGLWYMRRDAIKQGLMLPDDAQAKAADGGAGASKKSDSEAEASSDTIASSSTVNPLTEEGNTRHQQQQQSQSDLEKGPSEPGDDDAPDADLKKRGCWLSTIRVTFFSTGNGGNKRRSSGALAGSLAMLLTTVQKAVLTPPVIGIFIGVFIGLWADLRRALFERGGSLQPVGDVITLLGAPSIPVSNLILAGSLFQGLLDIRKRRAEARRLKALAAAELDQLPTHTAEAVNAIDAAGAVTSPAAQSALSHQDRDNEDDHIESQRSLKRPTLIANAGGSPVKLPNPYAYEYDSGSSSSIMKSLSRRLSRLSMNVSAESSSHAAVREGPLGAAAMPLHFDTPSGPVTLLLPVDPSSSSGPSALSRRPSYATGMIAVDAHVNVEDADASSAGINGDSVLQRSASFVSYLSRRLSRGESFSLVTLAPASTAPTSAQMQTAAGANIHDTRPRLQSSVLPRSRAASSASASAAGGSVTATSVLVLGAPSSLESARSSSSNSGGGRSRGDSAAVISGSGSGTAVSSVVYSASPSRSMSFRISNAQPTGTSPAKDAIARKVSTGSRSVRAGSWSVGSIDGSAAELDEEEEERQGTASGSVYVSSAGAASVIAGAAAGTLLRRSGMPRLGTLSALKEVPSNLDLEKLDQAALAAASYTADADVDVQPLPPVPKLPGDEDYDTSHTAGRGMGDEEGGYYSSSDDEESGSADASSSASRRISRRLSEGGASVAVSSSNAWRSSGAVANAHALRDGAIHISDDGDAQTLPRGHEEHHRAAHAAASSLLAAIASAPPNDEQPPISVRSAAALIVSRLVLSPLILFLLFVAAEAAHIPLIAPGAGLQDSVLRLVVLVEAAAPSAQSVLLLCQTTGNVRAAKDLSLVYVAMYPLSLVSMTVALMAAMAIVFSKG